ncbi:hypothetical protein Tco_0979938 [Tanacetum coccineum]
MVVCGVVRLKPENPHLKIAKPKPQDPHGAVYTFIESANADAVWFLPESASIRTMLTPTLNDETDFRVSFDDFDDEDYTVIFEKNSFSYKIISTNDLKTDSKNNNEKVNLPSLPSHEPAISCFEDLDFFKDFENEFPTIVYNDALTYKSDLLTEPNLNPQHVDEFDLNDETSLSEYDEEEQNGRFVLSRFVRLHQFPFNIILPDDLKSKNDNDDNDIDIIQSSEGNEIIQGSNVLSKTSHDKVTKTFKMGSFVINLKVNIVTWTHYANGMLFFLIMNLYVPFGIPFDPKRYYKDGDYAIMLRRPRYQGLEYTDADIADFEERIVMEHRDNVGVVVFTSQAWGRLFDTRGPLVWEIILEFLSMLRFGEVLLDLDAPDTIQEEIESPGFARRFTAGRKSGAHIFGGQFVGRLAQYFGLLTVEILQGLIVIAPELPIIDMAELPDAAAGAPRVAQDTPVIDEGGQADLAPVHAPPPPPPATARTMP